MKKTHLELAQIAFVEWLGVVDDLLETAQLQFEEGLGAGRNGDLNAFSAAIGIAMGHVEKARTEIKTGLEAGV